MHSSVPDLFSLDIMFQRFPYVKFFYVYLFLREERDRMCGGEGQREETQTLKQARGSELSTQSLMRGSNSRTARS